MTQTSPLNQGQERAAEGFFEFLFTDEKELHITGPGGVGKTYLMGYLIDIIMTRYFEACKIMGITPEYNEVVMTATTNKAADVLGHSTGRPTQTIHSFLNLTVKDDFSSGRSILSKTRSWMVHHNKIIFIDEGSMIDTPLKLLLHEGTHKCKIVYVSDHCQLAPVMESISPIYQPHIPFFELTEPMRNAEQPALMNVCNQLRETVKTGVFKPIKIVPGVIDFVDDNQMQQEIHTAFVNQSTNDRILAYTNKRVIEYNDYIRELRKLDDEYQIGDQLISNSAIAVGSGSVKRMLSVEEEVEIIDQDDLITQESIDVFQGQEVMMEVRHSRIKTAFGTYDNVPLPVNRRHFSDLIKFYQRNKNWNRYFYLKNTYPDLRQRDAATVHKAQGSTYDTVYIDLGNISTCHQPDQAARMLYVAFTRARNRIVLYGNLAEKYGGLIL